jgi:TPR repeat protein
MDDPNGPTRILQPDAAPPRPSPLTPDDHETLEVRRAVGDDYDVLGPICEINDGAKSSIGYLARRSGTSRLDVLRFAPGEYVDVVGPIGTALQDDADKCPKCGSPLRPGVRFCANCRANLATTRLGDAGSMSVAEWLEAKSEAVRHGFEPVGQVEDSKVRAALRGNELGATTMLLARASTTRQISALVLERASVGGSAVLGLEQSNALGNIVHAMLDVPTAVPARVAEPAKVAMPPAEPAAPAPAPLPPSAPTPVPPPSQGTPMWVRVATLTVSGALAIAAIAWLVSSTSSRNAAREAALLAARADSIRADSIRRDSIRADSLANLPLDIDSATVQLGATLPANATFTVDGKTVSGRVAKLAPGSHQLAVNAAGFQPATRTVDLQPGQSLVWPSKLDPVAKTEAPVRVASCREGVRRATWPAAFDVCMKEAKLGQGDGFAERSLGMMYELGRGTARNLNEAAEWYMTGATRGDSEAQYHAGLMLQDGRGVAKDERAAFSWFQQAAKAGLASAQTSLGLLYAAGRGVAKSDAEAVKWFKAAAAQGDDRAKQELAKRGIR